MASTMLEAMGLIPVAFFVPQQRDLQKQLAEG
jgi:catechol-2,3-dioxygenase